MDEIGGILVISFVECADENETVNGKGEYSKSGTNILVYTEDESVSKLFVKRIRSRSIIKELSFKTANGKDIFEGSYLIIKCKRENEGWFIELKENKTTLKR